MKSRNRQHNIFNLRSSRRRSSRISPNLFSYSRLEDRRLLAIDVPSQSITTDTVWDDPEGYRIVGKVLVTDGARLTIVPGIEVSTISTSSSHLLKIISGGTLEANGVKFIGEHNKILASAPSRIFFSNSEFSGRQFSIDVATLGEVSNSVFNTELLSLDQSEVSFTNNTLTVSRLFVETGVVPQLKENTFTA